MPCSYKFRLRATPSGSTELSRDGATYLAVVLARPRQDEPAQHRVPRGGKSGADGGRSLEPWLVRRAAGEEAALHSPGVRWVGLLPGLLWYPRAHTPELHFSGIIGGGAPEVKLAVV